MNTGSEGPALISPESGKGSHSALNGMMEWWNNGVLVGIHLYFNKK